jgi:hypothetical protein
MNWSDGLVEGAVAHRSAVAADLLALRSLGSPTGDALFIAGFTTMIGAWLLFAGMLPLSVPVARRPKGMAGWARRKAEARVRAVADALGAATPSFPRDAVVSFDARRRQVFRRMLFLLTPIYLLGAIGFLVGAAGVAVATFPGRSVPTSTENRADLYAGLLFAVFALVTFILVLEQGWIKNQVADLFAAQCLLRATELCLELRDPGVDPVGPRREINGQLGWAARYLYRHVGKVLPLGVRRRERRSVARHAERLATAIRQLQVTVTRASRADLAEMAPDLAELLAALAEDRLGDLPVSEQRRRDDDPSERVFLCYARIDGRAVGKLRRRLARDGHDPWMDIHDVMAGDQWKPVVMEALRSSGTVLVCLSAAAVAARGFHQKEIRAVLDVAQEFPEGARFVVPVRLEPCEVPRELSVYHWVDLFEPDGYDKLRDALGPAGPARPAVGAGGS